MFSKIKTKLVRVLRILQFITESYQDIWLFLRHNGFSPFESIGRRLSHKTIIEAHTIEKGLALPNPRPYFGVGKINGLLDMNENWSPPDGDLSRSMLIAALRDYQEAFRHLPVPNVVLFNRINTFLSDKDVNGAVGGSRKGIFRASEANFAAITFLQSRFSVREFDSKQISEEELFKIVTLAQRAPSQCNRQSSRLHIYRDRSKIDQLLALQGGARGFSDQVPNLFVVTSEITAWGGPQQRNQPYVDGGIYATMLLLSLDALGFVSCPLNLAISNRTERTIKAIGEIPSRERLIVMVAAGYPPDHMISAAQSPRWPANAIYKLHD